MEKRLSSSVLAKSGIGKSANESSILWSPLWNSMVIISELMLSRMGFYVCSAIAKSLNAASPKARIPVTRFIVFIWKIAKIKFTWNKLCIRVIVN